MKHLSWLMLEFFLLLFFCSSSWSEPLNLDTRVKGIRTILFGTHHKTGTHLYRGMQDYLVKKVPNVKKHVKAEKKMHKKCLCKANEEFQLCLSCKIDFLDAKKLLDEGKTNQFVHSIRSPLQALVSQRGYQIRYRETEPDKAAWKDRKKRLFFESVDAGEEEAIWLTTYHSMSGHLKGMIDVMENLQGNPQVLQLDLDDFMADFDTAAMSMLTFLFQRKKEGEIFEEETDFEEEKRAQTLEGKTLRVKILPELRKMFDISNNPKVDPTNMHHHEQSEKEKWLRGLKNFTYTSPEFAELKEMEDKYQELLTKIK